MGSIFRCSFPTLHLDPTWLRLQPTRRGTRHWAARQATTARRYSTGQSGSGTSFHPTVRGGSNHTVSTPSRRSPQGIHTVWSGLSGTGAGPRCESGLGSDSRVDHLPVRCPTAIGSDSSARPSSDSDVDAVQRTRQGADKSCPPSPHQAPRRRTPRLRAHGASGTQRDNFIRIMVFWVYRSIRGIGCIVC